VARIRLTRQRFNPVPGTKSTQSRYFLGYFVFVDEPDVGYAVAIRAAAPPGTAGLIKQRALAKAEEAAQKLSDKTDRDVAFMPVLPQATKFQAVEHLYGGEGSLRFGGPHAVGSATLSRSRLPARAVNETALASVQAHWESLYGPGKVGQRGWPRASPAFRTPAAYTPGLGTIEFAPASRKRAQVEAERAAQAEIRAELAKTQETQRKVAALAERPGTEAEGEAAAQILSDLERKSAELQSKLTDWPYAYVLSEIVDFDPKLPKAVPWLTMVRLAMDPQLSGDVESVGTAASLLVTMIESNKEDLRDRFRRITVSKARDVVFNTQEFQDLREMGISGSDLNRGLLEATLQVLVEQGVLPEDAVA
jgi:hypothetical protein